ncbi:hypothetical protein GBAR_LOCUS832 [Geodia barretti]|uniref:Uncharacterized protein n=1 Tax=Geodia barretti TaxID=519541 RepID=A0AA35QUU0_GEOBA|nr:hypothetical protein GBAR_LOCUS832 [Geodia barretti]
MSTIPPWARRSATRRRARPSRICRETGAVPTAGRPPPIRSRGGGCGRRISGPAHASQYSPISRR